MIQRPTIAIPSTVVTVLALAAGAVPAAAVENGRIAFQANVGKFPQVFTIRPDGTGLRQITHVTRQDPGAENPVWLPDGRTIAFDAATRSGVSIFTVPASGGTATELQLGVGDFNGDPAYSPDGAQISFDQDVGDAAPTVHGIFAANADGSDPRRVTTGLPTKKAFDTESQWSPDGRQIAFTRVKSGRQAAIFVVNADGTGLKQLTRYKLDAASPDWSPDGKTILFNTYWDSPGGRASNLFAISPSGGHRTALTHDRASNGAFVASFRPSWAPDGKQIVFTHINFKKKSATAGLYTIRPDGTHRKRLTHMGPKRFATNPDWGIAP
jgi:Tol biopolymer transport system component